MLKLSKVNIQSIINNTLKFTIVSASTLAVIGLWKVMIRFAIIIGLGDIVFQIFIFLSCILLTALTIIENMKIFTRLNGD